ncbi:hypothetical protein OIO90_004616 [Microbotryomycetes sp. JL221]|nr:hypothetical protein OIO90_004616 [Microbotryomycetes sp. JL221]
MSFATGRAEPILLMLVDSGTPFEQEVITRADWLVQQELEERHPSRYPFGQLPTLTFGHGARGGNDTVLGETSAILHFLSEKLAPIGAVKSPPDARARLEQIRSASATVIDRLLPFANPDGAHKGNSKLRAIEVISEPYLESLEYHLNASFFPPLLVAPLTDGQPGTTLSPAAATAATALSLILDRIQTYDGSRSKTKDQGLDTESS